jgi:uncharacterized protein YPO0396
LAGAARFAHGGARRPDLRRNRIDVEDAMFAKEVAAHEEELDQLEAELEKGSVEGKAKIQKRIQDTKQKLQSKREQIKSRMESVKRERDAKSALMP